MKNAQNKEYLKKIRGLSKSVSTTPTERIKTIIKVRQG